VLPRTGLTEAAATLSLFVTNQISEQENIMNESTLYTSESSAKSLWQQYHIYSDRVEFDTLFGTMSVPFDEIETVDVAASDMRGLLRGDLKLKNFRPALKLDWANFTEHVVLDKTGGRVRRLLFTPDDPHRFKLAFDAALSRFRGGTAASQ
jgi:hypothetical protein